MSTSKIIVLITGANQGIGYEAARLFASSTENSHHVIVGSRSLSRGQEAVSTLQASCPADSLSTVQLDITDPASIAAAIEEVSKKHGRLDVLVNNAAVLSDPTSIMPAVDKLHAKYGHDKSVVKPMAEQLRKCLDTNTIGTADITERFLPLLRKSKHPKIVFVSSNAGSLTSAATPGTAANAVAYRASKAALNMLMIEWTKILGEEGIKIWGVCPGFNATNFGRDEENGTNSIEKFKEAGAQHPSVGAQVILDVSEGRRDEGVGRVCAREGFREW